MPHHLTIRSHDSAPFETVKQRTDFAHYVSRLLTANEPNRFEPEGLNDRSTAREWTVDPGNDWWVFFDTEDPRCVRIQHRYGNEKALRALCDWIAYRWDAEVLDTAAA